MQQPSPRTERGAAMVEFALVLPILVMLVMGIVDFSRAYHVQTSVSNAAREGVRVMALNKDPDPAKVRAAARAAAKSAATTLAPGLTDSQLTFAPTACTTGAQVTMTVKYTTKYITGLPGMIGVGDTITLTGKGTMRCNG